jgi:CheY-like chemotaxis protein
MMLTDRSIVIAEDNAVLRSVLTEIFRECGWRVRSAEDGFASLQAFAEEVPAVLLSDLEMHGMSGFELLSIVRRRFPSIRVVAMSGAFTGRAIPAGVAADAFYAKGGSISTLLDIVTEIASSQPHATRQSDVPVWLPSNLHSSAPHGVLWVACSNCLRAVYVSHPHAREESHLTCPHCHQQLTVFLLHESPDLLRPVFQPPSPTTQRTPSVSSHRSESAAR